MNYKKLFNKPNTYFLKHKKYKMDFKIFLVAFIQNHPHVSISIRLEMRSKLSTDIKIGKTGENCER